MPAAVKRVTVKRVYEKPARGDGYRVLVDRLWPRGLSKSQAALHSWLRDLSPSDQLRRWFHARPESWLTFRKRYLKELALPQAARRSMNCTAWPSGRRILRFCTPPGMSCTTTPWS